MPSPFGHALAGLAVGWAAGPTQPSSTGRWNQPITIACVAAAVLPDLDLVHSSLHRTVTHSVGATLLIISITAAVTGWVTGAIAWRVALVVGAAHASHLLLDWLGVDRRAPMGLQALWPFSDQWFISGWGVFLPTERRNVFTLTSLDVNARAALRELAILGPIAAAAWAVRRTRQAYT
jgi:inner membrane protein